MIRTLARRWADKKLLASNDDLRRRLIGTNAANERLLRERNQALDDLAGVRANLAREQQRHHDTRTTMQRVHDAVKDANNATIDGLYARVRDLQAHLEQLGDQPLADTNAQLRRQIEELQARLDRTRMVQMADYRGIGDEAAAKRYDDGLGDR